MSMGVRDNDGNIVTDASDIKQRWKKYFEWLLNVDDGRKVELTESDLGVMHELANGELEIGVEDVRKTVRKLKGGKLPGVDGITGEMLKCGGESLLEWLRKFFNPFASIGRTGMSNSKVKVKVSCLNISFMT